MRDRITKDDIGRQEKRQVDILGYQKYFISGRYNYQAIDMKRSINDDYPGSDYRTRLTKRLAFEYVRCILDGAEAMRDILHNKESV